MLIFTKGTRAEIRAICIHLDKIWFNHKWEDVDRNEANMLIENAQTMNKLQCKTSKNMDESQIFLGRKACNWSLSSAVLCSWAASELSEKDEAVQTLILSVCFIAAERFAWENTADRYSITAQEL